MPFGTHCEYEDFDACVRDNQTKADPSAYCAELMKATEAQCRGEGMDGYEPAQLRATNLLKARTMRRLAAFDEGLANALRNVRLPWYVINEAIPSEEESPTDPEEPVSPAEDTTDVMIYDEIGGSFGVSASEFVSALDEITTPHISLRINSPGGAVFDAIAIYNALVRHPAYVTSYVDALAASSASLVAMAGDEIVMMQGSELMIHDAAITDTGNAADKLAMNEWLNKQSDNIANVYAARAGGTTQDWRERMIAETWLLGTEAVECGLADRVYERQKRMPPGMPPPVPPGEIPPKKDGETPGEPMPPEEDEEDEDTATNALQYARMMMATRHTLHNRGFNYSGRGRAPKPIVMGASGIRIGMAGQPKPSVPMVNELYDMYRRLLNTGGQ